MGIVYSKIIFGLVFIEESNWEMAKEYFMSCVDILNELDASFYLKEVYLGMSIILNKLNDTELANEFKRNANIIK